MTGGIVRAGTVDIEVLRLGDDPPERPQGYGLGLVADRPLDEAIARLRRARLPDLGRAAGDRGQRRAAALVACHAGPRRSGPSGIRRIVLAGAAGAPFTLGDVECCGR